jgi:hypothetical protein
MTPKVFKAAAEMLGPKHYVALLASTIGLTVIAPLVEHYIWARAAVGALIIFVLLTASFAVGSGHAAFKNFLLAALTAVMWTLAFTCNIAPFNTVYFGIASYAVALLFFLTTCSIMWQDIFSGVVTVNRICGAVCIYILVGFCFAMVHMMVVLADPSAYKDNSVTTQPISSTEVLSAERRYPIFVYFSFCTLSTLGYGDIVPVSRLARSISWVEGLTGQLYLAILVARLVGLHIAGAAPHRLESLDPSQRTKPSSELEHSRR